MINNLFFASRVQRLLSEANIELVHFIPGRIRLKSVYWKEIQKELEIFINDLLEEPKVKSATFSPDTGSLVIEFDPSISKDKVIEKWLLRAKGMKYNEKKQWG